MSSEKMGNGNRVNHTEIQASVIYRGWQPGQVWRGHDFITPEDYDEAIEALLQAKSQLKPDGNNCSVCGDSGHQAWECHHNPLVMARKGAKSEYQWRCFHCGFFCYDEQTARAHFGQTDAEVARCLEKLAKEKWAKEQPD